MRTRVSTLFILLVFVFLARLFHSCVSPACLGETTSYLNAGFYKTGTGKPFTPDSVTVYGLGKTGSYIYKKATSLTTIKLPLDASSESAGFVMKINNVTDTLIFTYTSFPHLISKECGYTFFFTLDSCEWKGRIIDTINIRNNKVTIFNEENIRIFY
jgi:hypothetical protein